MVITCVSGFCKPLKKTHPFWGGLTLFCLIGALTSGSGLLKPKKMEEETEKND